MLSRRLPPRRIQLPQTGSIRLWSCSKRGLYEEALQAHDKAIKIDPKSGESWHTKGRALFFLKRYTLARHALYTALELGYSEARKILEIMRKAGL